MKLLASPPFRFRLGAYTFGHFAVEFVANYFLITIIGPHLVQREQMITMLLIYNACDYGLQVLIGLADDIVRRNHFFAAVGPVFIICSYFFGGDALVMGGVLGVGMAFSHVPMGRQVLQDAPDRYTALSIFVSSGVLGVFLGRQVAFTHIAIWWQLIAILAVFAVLLLALGSRESQWNNPAEQRTQNLELHLDWRSYLAILTLMVVIILQSFASAAMVFQWSLGWLAWGEAFAICFGKAFGGVFADRFGYRNTVLYSLSAAVIMAGFSISIPVLGIIFLFCFNLTGATIIARLPRHLPSSPGTAFGLYKMMHFIGFCPILLCGAQTFCTPFLLIVLTIVVGVLMFLESFVAPAVERKGD